MRTAPASLAAAPAATAASGADPTCTPFSAPPFELAEINAAVSAIAATARPGSLPVILIM
jgi:hypothetical protein